MNRFDIIVVFASLVGTIYENASPSTQTEGFELILILRSLRLIKLIGGFKRFRLIINTIGTIIPSLIIYLMLVAAIFYIFPLVGL